MQITPTTPHLGCVIMASGLGKRFGGNKLMADFDGQPLICRALTVTDGLFSHRVVVTRHADVAGSQYQMPYQTNRKDHYTPMRYTE